MDETTLTEILNAIQSLRIEISSLRGVNGGEDKTRVIYGTNNMEIKYL